jgi:hypothetical protein
LYGVLLYDKNSRLSRPVIARNKWFRWQIALLPNKCQHVNWDAYYISAALNRLLQHTIVVCYSVLTKRKGVGEMLGCVS